ncbi:hypothetical protein M8475_003566 [Vibrio parahaemolyticus]|nr:hypothetical protein [Vibrio parahaemolyticus]
MKKYALAIAISVLLSGFATQQAFAEEPEPEVPGQAIEVVAGDSSYGTAKFSGFVSGFASNGNLIVTGSGGSRDEAAYTAELNVSQNGTFDAKKSVVLESHVYDQENDLVGDIYADVDWVIEQVVFAGDLSAEQQNELHEKIEVKDAILGTIVKAGDTGKIANVDFASGTDQVHLVVSNTEPLSNELSVGSFLTVGVNMVATAI